jgi:hypothetical protein
MAVMILGKLRGMPTHTDIITDFDFREVCTLLRLCAVIRDQFSAHADTKLCRAGQAIASTSSGG